MQSPEVGSRNATALAMDDSSASQGGGLTTLDSIGRWLLGHFDYRVCALVALGAVAVFVVWRRQSTGTWPSIPQLFQVAFGSLSILGGGLVGVIFLLTKPPAVGELSADKLGLIGIITVIATFYLGCAQVSAAFSPPKPAPPGENRPQDHDTDPPSK